MSGPKSQGEKFTIALINIDQTGDGIAQVMAYHVAADIHAVYLGGNLLPAKVWAFLDE